MKKKYTAKDIRLLKPNNDVYIIDISREGFRENLISSAQYALEFARSLVVNRLPSELHYTISETASDNFHENESYIFLDAEKVVEYLWRDGKVPEWVNVFVISANERSTLIKLDCCRRYSNDIKDMYHAREGRAPFHVLGPPAPPDYINNKAKYDIFWNEI